jgi:hypothetical protein
MNSMLLENVGQIVKADIKFGDLTVFVGPQATGKSIALQFLKLMVDTGQVQAELGRYGIDWEGKLDRFLDAYFGEGMRTIWRDEKSKLNWSNSNVDLKRRVSRKQKNKDESLFFIPAQRVLALRDGWPRPFTDYSPGDPFAVREFSERLRVLVEQEFGGSDQIFPQPRRLKSEFRDLLKKHVFSEFHLQVDKVRSQKRLVLGEGTNGDPLPYMVWSAGQREFVPLLLGLYWLMPPTKVSTRGNIKWVVLEEPEMGLHPRAISVVLLMIFELVVRGYRVCVSTHSPHVLEAIWALRQLRENDGSPADLLAAFEATNTQTMRKLAQSMMEKDVKVFYFDREKGTTKDISILDPAGEEEGESGWGGLTEFSGRVNTVVARTVANS